MHYEQTAGVTEQGLRAVLYAVLSHSVVSDSLCPPWTVSCQALLSMGILQAGILDLRPECSFRRVSS